MEAHLHSSKISTLKILFCPKIGALRSWHRASTILEICELFLYLDFNCLFFYW